MEEWRDIKGFEGLYQISNYGRVKRLKFAHVSASGITTWVEKEKILKPKRDKKGYLFVALGCGKKDVRPNKKIARLVAETFIENKNPLANQVDHIDRNKQNNNVSNLRWVTNEENARNKTTNRFVTYKEETMIITDMAKKYNINVFTLMARLDRGWSVEDALLKPVKDNWRNRYGRKQRVSC